LKLLLIALFAQVPPTPSLPDAQLGVAKDKINKNVNIRVANPPNQETPWPFDTLSTRWKAGAELFKIAAQANWWGAEAERSRIENWQLYLNLMRENQALLDENKFRGTTTYKLIQRVAHLKLYVDAKKQELLLKEQLAELRKEELNTSPAKEHFFVVEGIRYASMREFRGTAHYREWIVRERERFKGK
jgi:hypothetical protein